MLDDPLVHHKPKPREGGWQILYRWYGHMQLAMMAKL